MELHDDVAKEEMAKMAQRQRRDRSRIPLTNVKGRHGELQDQRKSKSPMRRPSNTTTTTLPGSNKDGWETVGKSGRGKKVVPNQQEAASAGWNPVSSVGKSAGRSPPFYSSPSSRQQGSGSTKSLSGLAVNDDKQQHYRDKDKRNYSKKDKDRSADRISKLEKNKERWSSKTAALPRQTPPSAAITSDKLEKMGLNKRRDVCEKFKNAVEELTVTGDIEEAMDCIIEMAASPDIYCELISHCVTWAVEHKDEERKALQWFLSAGLERGIIDQQDIDAGFKNFVSNLPDKIIDIPMATKYTAGLLGPFLADGVVMADIITNPPEDLVLMGKADVFATDCLSAARAAGGDAERLAELWSVDLGCLP